MITNPAGGAVLISIPVGRFNELERAERALKLHLCEYDMADWLACGGHGECPGEAPRCEVCEEHDKGNHRHALATRLRALEAAARELITWGVEFDDERLGYLTVQVDREALADLQALLPPRAVDEQADVEVR